MDLGSWCEQIDEVSFGVEFEYRVILDDENILRFEYRVILEQQQQ